MKRIVNETLKKHYIDKYNLNNIFSKDMTKYMEVMFFEKGEFLCREKEPIEYLSFFVKGKAKVFRTLSNGKSLLIYFYHAFTVFGDLELINGNDADANIRAIEDSYCISLPLSIVRNMLINDVKYLRFACESVGKKLVSTSKNCSINLLYPLENRLASYILATSDCYNKNVFDESLMHISELLAVSYRHLLRTINSFIEKDILVKNNGCYEVKNMEIIKNLAGDLYK